MRGTIRIAIGLVITFGAVGGIENNGDLLQCSLLALAGLLITYSGVEAMKGNE
jgi:hypothetical protein